MHGERKIATEQCKIHAHSFFFPKPPTPFDLYQTKSPKLIPTAAVTSTRRKKFLKSRTRNELHQARQNRASRVTGKATAAADLRTREGQETHGRRRS